MTRSTVSTANKVCFAVPEIVPGVDGFVGKVTVQSRSIAVVRIAR